MVMAWTAEPDPTGMDEKLVCETQQELAEAIAENLEFFLGNYDSDDLEDGVHLVIRREQVEL